MSRKCDDKGKNEQRRVIHSLGPSLLRRVDGTKLMWVVDYAGVSNIFTFRSSVPLDALLQACHLSLMSYTILVLPALCRALTLSRRCLTIFCFVCRKGERRRGTLREQCIYAAILLLVLRIEPKYRMEKSDSSISRRILQRKPAGCIHSLQDPIPYHHHTAHSWLRVDLVRLPY